MIVLRFVIVMFYCSTVTELSFLIGIRSKWSRELDFHFRFRATSDQSCKPSLGGLRALYGYTSEEKINILFCHEIKYLRLWQIIFNIFMLIQMLIYSMDTLTTKYEILLTKSSFTYNWNAF